MNIEFDLPTETIMHQLLKVHSLNYILWLALKTYGYHSPEYLADKITKIVDEVEEDE